MGAGKDWHVGHIEPNVKGTPRMGPGAGPEDMGSNLFAQPAQDNRKLGHRKATKDQLEWMGRVEKSGQKTAVKDTEKAAVKAGEKAAVKAGEKTAVKAGEKAAVKGLEKVGAKSGGGALGKLAPELAWLSLLDLQLIGTRMAMRWNGHQEWQAQYQVWAQWHLLHLMVSMQCLIPLV